MRTVKHFVLLTVAGLLTLNVAAKTEVVNFRVQNSDNPIAVEDRHPVFSWQMLSDERGQSQSAYRLQVTRRSDGSQVWDSGCVQDDCSVGIPYQGVALQPEMGYDVSLEVWDASGASYKSSANFETSLMSPRIKAWKGAKWIGSHELTLDAQSQFLFAIQSDFQILEGGVASLILGADDARLSISSMFNEQDIVGDNYVRVDFDLSGVGKDKGAEMRIYRVGYARGDKADKPLFTINSSLYPETNINDIFTEANASAKHSVKIEVGTGSLSVTVDDKGVISEKPRRGGFGNFGGFTVGMTAFSGMASSSRPTSFAIAPTGTGGDYVTFPNLCSVGFAALPRSKVVYTDYQILDAGQSVDNVVFASDRYDIFKAIPSVSIEGNAITVANSGKTATIGWADPSYGGETMLRTEFKTASESPIVSARLYATSMGIYNFFINGEKVGDAWFAPGDSQYRETMGYHKYDVTEMLRSGENALGAQLAGGWYTGYMTFTATNYNFFGDYEALLSRLVIKYEDGTTQEIVSSPESWKYTKDGPVRLSSFFQGERYDATREAAVAGWSEPGFDDSAWKKAEEIEQREWVDFDLMARYDEPVKVREILTAQKVMPVHDEHAYIYNMGVNMVGVPSVTIPAGWLKKGDVVMMAYGEQVYPGLKGDKKEYIQRFGRKGRNIAGQILFETNRAALDLDFYVASGSEEVTIQPSLTFRGYQYIQIYLPSHEGPLPLENIRGLVLSSCEVPSGTYTATTTDGTGALVNQLFKNIQRSQLGNYLTLPTDCPQRNERMGWTGDAQAYTRTGIYNADIQNFLRQWMVALRADQGIGNDREVPGGIGSTVPTYNKSDDTTFANGTTWSAAVCMVPWQMYTQYGDTQIIEDNIETMMDWLNGMAFYKTSEEYPYLSSKASGLADHLALDSRTPPDILNNAIYIYMMEVTAIMADAIGRDDYAAILRERHDLAKANWNAAYVNPANGKTRSMDGRVVHTQASYATPLNFNVFNDENKAKAEAYLALLAAKPAESGPTAEESEAEKVQGNSQPASYGASGVFNVGTVDYNFKPWTITTGFSGTPNILPALSRGGFTNEAYRLISSTELPSWLYPVTEGATSMWERWNSYDNAFSVPNNNSMNSFNHFALGAVGQWMYEYQLGITTDHGAGEAGYKHFVLQPTVGGTYTSLKGSYNSNYGEIGSAWTADGRGRMLSYEAIVPANTSATLYLPVGDSVSDCRSIEGARFIGRTIRNGLSVAQYELVSGKYSFDITNNSITVQ